MSQIHCKINIMCIDLMIADCKNNAIHCNCNDICIARVLIHCKKRWPHSGRPRAPQLRCFVLRRSTIWSRDSALGATLHQLHEQLSIYKYTYSCTHVIIYVHIHILYVISRTAYPRTAAPSAAHPLRPGAHPLKLILNGDGIQKDGLQTGVVYKRIDFT